MLYDLGQLRSELLAFTIILQCITVRDPFSSHILLRSWYGHHVRTQQFGEQWEEVKAVTNHFYKKKNLKCACLYIVYLFPLTRANSKLYSKIRPHSFCGIIPCFLECKGRGQNARSLGIFITLLIPVGEKWKMWWLQLFLKGWLSVTTRRCILDSFNDI